MTDELMLRRKWTLRAGRKRIVLVKRSHERAEHVVMKALLWALYLPLYPNLTVEVSVGDRYKPDVVAVDAFGRPRFWGEAGEIGVAKIRSLARRYRHTHFAIAKRDTSLDPFIAIVRDALDDLRRDAPFDLIRFPADSAERFIDDEGRIRISHADVEWIRFS